MRKFSIFLLLLGGMLFTTAHAAGVTGVKVRIPANGLYRLTDQQVADSLGVNVATVTGQPLRVEHLGFPVPAVRSEGGLDFFANGYSSRYTDLNVYRVTLESGEEPELRAVTPAAGAPQASFTVTNRFENQVFIRPDIFSDPAEDPWLWYQLISSIVGTFSTSFDLDRLAAGSGGTLSVRMKGASAHTHGCRILVNGTVVTQATIYGQSGVTVEAEIPPGILLETANEFRLEMDPPSGVNFDKLILDYFSIVHERRYEPDSDQLIFSAEPGSVKVSGFTTNVIEVWALDDLWTMAKLDGVNVTPTGGMWCVDFETADAGRFIAFAGSRTNLLHGPWVDSDLKFTNHEVDYMLVYAPGLEVGSGALVTNREARGLRTKMVDIESVYNTFNYGIVDGRVLKTFLSYAYYQWSEGPRYLCLVGDGTIDFKNVAGAGDCLLPTEPEGSPYGIFSSDHKLADVNNDSYIEVAVGRIPVTTSQQLSNFVDKLLAYEAGDAWRTDATIATDIRDVGGVYINDGNALESIITNQLPVERADLEVLGLSDTIDAVEDGMEDGTEMLIFVGHGNLYQMAKSPDPIMNVSSFASVTNGSRPTLVGALSCLIGSFTMPNSPSLGKTMMNSDHGAVGLFGSAALITLVECTEVSKELLSGFYEQDMDRFGDAWIYAKNKMVQTNLLRVTRNYQYMGDPALAIGDANAPRGGGSLEPEAPPYSVWQAWSFPAAWQDIGIGTGPDDNPDGDELTNDEERRAGTDPLDDSSELVIVNIRRPGPGEAEVTWPSFAGRLYRVERSDDAASGYSLLIDDVPADPPYNALVDTNAVTDSTTYRVFLK